MAAALAAAGAAQAGPTQTVNLPEGALDAALVALAAQTHEQLLYPPELAQGRRAPALSGRFTAEEALRRLFPGEEVVITRPAPGVLVLRRRSEPTPTAGPGGGPPRPFGGEADHTAIEMATAPGAATTTSPDPAAAAATVEEVQVTGTHIRGARTASPLLVLDRAALDRSGHATVAAALGALPQNFSGVANEGASTTGADRVGRNSGYGSSVNLRGLGPDATLVLVNGRRLAGAGSFGDFADISTLPSAAVQRVEVLLDGASALYGADAVGGVVNIIMRRDYEGAETRLTAGASTDGEPTELQLSQLLGRRWDGGGLLVAYELRRRSRLSGDDRDFAADADLRRFGGSDQRLTNAFPGNILTTGPSGTVVGWAIPAGQDGVGLRPQDLLAGQANLGNQRRGVDILPRQDLHALYVAADQQLGEAVELTADLRYGRRDFGVRLSSSIANIAVTRANPFFVSPTGASSHSVAYSFAEEVGNARLDGRQESLALTLGATARLPRAWRGEGYLAFAQERTATHARGTVNTALLAEAVGSVADRPETPFSAARDGYFNPFSGTPGANSPALLAVIGSGYADTHTRGQVMSANLQADGTLLTLPGGPLQAAVGGQLRRETLVRTGMSFSASPTPVPQQGADVARSVAAAFLELRAPLVGPENRRPGLERLELSLAGRVERYSDVGTTANPKAGLLWAPVDGLTVRATYGRSFRAPALREVHDPEAYSGSLLPLGAGRIRTLLLNGGNPDLRPETATTWTAGADWTPAALPGLRLGATWFEVRFEDRIGKPVQENILNALSDPTLASFITRISPADNAADRALMEALLASPALIPASAGFPPEAYGAIADNRYVNTADLRVSGVDLTGSWTVDLGDDRIALGASGSWILAYEQRTTPDAAAVDRAGVANFPVDFRGRLTADWTRGRLTAGAALNYVSAYEDALGTRIAAQPSVDLQLRLAPAETGPLKGIAATLGVRNAFDRDPPFYDNVAGVAYDPANADPIGRFAWVQLTRAW